MSIEERAKNCQGNCPECSSNNLEYGGIEIDGEVAWYDYDCLDCGDKGREHYDLTYWGTVSDKETIKLINN
jgi:hypothetical protein